MYLNMNSLTMHFLIWYSNESFRSLTDALSKNCHAKILNSLGWTYTLKILLQQEKNKSTSFPTSPSRVFPVFLCFNLSLSGKWNYDFVYLSLQQKTLQRLYRSCHRWRISTGQYSSTVTWPIVYRLYTCPTLSKINTKFEWLNACGCANFTKKSWGCFWANLRKIKDDRSVCRKFHFLHHFGLKSDSKHNVHFEFFAINKLILIKAQFI